MSANFSFPVGWIFASRIQSLPLTGPWNRKPRINAARAANKTAKKLIVIMFILSDVTLHLLLLSTLIIAEIS